MSRPPLAPRPHRSVPAVLVAVVLLAVAILVVWTCAQRLTAGTWPAWWSALGGAEQSRWHDAAVIGLAAGACVVGLVMFLSAVIPGPRSALKLAGSDTQHEIVVTRSGLARLTTTTAARVSGVDGVSTSVSSGQVAVRVSTPSASTDDVRRRVSEEVGARLTSLGIQPPPRVTVTARSTEGRV